ncbi:MAG TPA: class I SAM-dependent methyltransferase family protein [Thermoplasmata archaeon]
MKPSPPFVGALRAIAVPKENAESLLRKLLGERLVDRTMKTEKHGEAVLIPVRSAPAFDLGPFRARMEDRQSLPIRITQRDPRQEIRERLMAAGIPVERAPRRWERIGDILVLRFPPRRLKEARMIAQIFGTVLRARTVVQDVSGIHGPLRVPDVRVLWGNGTETVHVEGGIRYALDVGRVMFSSGNLAERIGIADRVRPGAVVVDLFAGIGYFSLPIAVRSRAAAVYACELNPVAFRYLVENTRLNRTSNLVPLLGDCRDVAPPRVADWVIMGHFHAREYLDVAFQTLRGKGTIVYHELCPKEQYPDALTRRLAAAARARWMNVRAIRTRIVKSYAPGIVHSRAEVEVARQSRP